MTSGCESAIEFGCFYVLNVTDPRFVTTAR